MTTELKQKLDSITKTKNFNYKGKNVVIDRYKEVNSTSVVVWIDNRPNNFLMNELESFINEIFEPTENNSNKNDVPTVFIPKEAISFQPTKENESIKETLMDALKKVKEDPTYIPQASAICNITSQMINLQKEEIKMIQILKRKN